MTVFYSPEIMDSGQANCKFVFASAPIPSGAAITYRQKVWDPGVSRWVYWNSSGSADVSGSSFVSPASTPFGSCTGYRITSIT